MQHLKACSPAKWWDEIKRLSGMEGPVGSRDNVLKSIHHLEGARGISADDLANHINKDLSKTSTSTFALSLSHLSFPRLQKIMLFMTL